MVTMSLDPGTPFPAFPEGGGTGIALRTTLCLEPGCEVLHVDGIEVAADAKGVDVSKSETKDYLSFTFDPAKTTFDPAGPEATAWLESDKATWLAPWVLKHADLLRSRLTNLKNQRAPGSPYERPAPEWAPGTSVYHGLLYPYGFCPSFSHANGTWRIADAYCPDPACDCGEATFLFYGPQEERIQISGKLGPRAPRGGHPGGRALWEAVFHRPKLVAFLERRRGEVRELGPFIVGAAFEQVRLAAPHEERTLPAEDVGGYLQSGRIPATLLVPLFDVASRLWATKDFLLRASGFWFQVEVEQPGEAEPIRSWLRVNGEPGFEVHEKPDEEFPWLDFGIVERGEVSLPYLRQRVALGLPLIAGTSVPLITGLDGEGSPVEPGADDLRRTIATAEALIVAASAADPSNVLSPVTFAHTTQFDTGPIVVRLTAGHPDAPWQVQSAEAAEGEGETPSVEPAPEPDDDTGVLAGLRTAVAAFIDAIIDRGLPDDTIDVARIVGGELERYLASHRGAPIPWFDVSRVERFLADYLPHQGILDKTQIEPAIVICHALATWLGEVKYADPEPLSRAIERAKPIFRKRAVERPLAPPVKDIAGSAKALEGRWKPGAGDPLPEGTATCPCGSGRRYKKCCMPR